MSQCLQQTGTDDNNCSESTSQAEQIQQTINQQISNMGDEDEAQDTKEPNLLGILKDDDEDDEDK